MIPGDYIYVDAAGGVVIPGDRIRDVLDGAREVDREDAAALASIHEQQRAFPSSATTPQLRAVPTTGTPA